MYSYIKGKVTHKDTEKKICVIETNGIGFEIVVSESTLQEINCGQELKFYIVEVSSGMYSGTLPTLYGFLTLEEKEIFEVFKSNLDNVGPKKAMEYLDKVKKNLTQFKLAIKTKNYKVLTSLFGFRHSTAEKIISSLSQIKEITEVVSEDNLQTDLYTDLISALVNLGYKEYEVKPYVIQVIEEQKINYSKINNTTDIVAELLPKVLKKIHSM